MINNHEYTIRIHHGRMSSMVPGLLSGHHIPRNAGWSICSTGYCVGRIHSVFRSSLNIQFLQHGEQRLIHVGTEEHGLCCFGVTVPEALMKLLVGSCQPGNQVVFKKGCLYLYSPDRVFVLELDAFEQTELKIPVVTALEEADGVQTAVDELLLYQELERMAETLELGLERDALFYQYARVLESAKRAEELKDAIRFFVGRGQGLTPGGDDILTGYGAVLQAFGEADLLVQILKDMSVDTTDVSRAYLTAMMEGYANETFCHIILQIFCKEVLKLRELLCRIEKIGNTSGRDILYGMYLGLRKIKEAYIV